MEENGGQNWHLESIKHFLTLVRSYRFYRNLSHSCKKKLHNSGCINAQKKGVNLFKFPINNMKQA